MNAWSIVSPHERANGTQEEEDDYESNSNLDCGYGHTWDLSIGGSGGIKGDEASDKFVLGTVHSFCNVQLCICNFGIFGGMVTLFRVDSMRAFIVMSSLSEGGEHSPVSKMEYGNMPLLVSFLDIMSLTDK